MKKIIGLQITLALLLAAAPLASVADTFFSDDFSNGSTLTNATPGVPTTNSTSYELISSKVWNPPPSIAPGHLIFGITNTTGGTIEVEALFASAPIALVSAGDYIQLSVTFTDTQGLLIQTGPMDFGMYNADGVAPWGGGLNGNATTASNTVALTGGAQNWRGYVAQIAYTGGNSGFYIRTNQSTAAPAGNNNQDLVTQGSSTKSYYNPKGVVIGAVSQTPDVALTVGNQYTEILKYTLTSTNTLQLDSRLYTGPDNTGTLLSMMSTNTTTNLLSKVFDGLAFGWYCTGNVTNTTIDVNSIIVSGTATPTTNPPTINTEPVPVSVATNGSCAFSVSATGIGLTYQWHRNGTNLLDGGNISGSTGSLLAISPAGLADALSDANGYYVTVTGIGNLSTNSTTNSLTLMPATNLIWTAAAGGTWDLNSTASWKDTNNNQTVFNYGDPVTFDDSAGLKVVTLNGTYLGAASVTVDTAIAYTFQGSGSFAGSGSLMVKGSGELTINNANTYSGGTIISNATALLLLKNLSGLGNGPVTFAKAGGTMEIVPTGGGSSGINGDIVVADDFTIQFDGLGSYSGVFLGNLSGTAGKTLTLVPDPLNTTTNDRIRIYGANTTYNAKLALASLIIFTPYNSSGSQTYNGVISGDGGIMEKGTITYLNGANTYSGGTFPVSGTIGLGIDSVGNPVTSGPVGTGPLFLTVDSTTKTTDSGMILASGGARAVANSIQYPSATNNLTLIIGGTNALTLSGAITLNGNDDAFTNRTYINRTFQVTNTALTTFSGVVSDKTNGVSAGYGFIKTGNGILALNNTETYTGPTTVSNGTLQVNGQLNVASAVTVATDGILGGTGTVNGPVTVQQGGTLAPGASIGTLAINGGLTLNGNLLFEVNKSLSPQSNDIATVSGALTNIGTGYLAMANLGPALAVGDKFKLFNKPLTNGAVLGVTGSGVAWTNKLATDGSVSVVSLTAPKPAITSTIVSGVTPPGTGMNLIFSGTNGISGAPFYVLYQTNLATPLSNWIRLSTNYFLTGGAFSVTNTISRTNRFFLLSVPQ